MLEVILKSFDTPDETRVFEKGILELCELAEWCLAGRVMNPAGNGLNM
jgi:hypothetical protein